MRQVVDLALRAKRKIYHLPLSFVSFVSFVVKISFSGLPWEPTHFGYQGRIWPLDDTSRISNNVGQSLPVTNNRSPAGS